MVILEETLPNRYLKIMFYIGILTKKQCDHFFFSGGVLTPAAAFTGTSLIDRLNENGVVFSVLSCKESGTY